jgi:hypothetical protein
MIFDPNNKYFLTRISIRRRVNDGIQKIIPLNPHDDVLKRKVSCPF